MDKKLRLQKEIEKAKKLRKELKQLEEKQDKELTMKLKKLKIKFIDKLLEKEDTSNKICYVCQEKATRIVENIMIQGTFYLSAVCFYFLTDKKGREDYEGFQRHLEAKNIELYEVYPAGRKPYWRFRKRGQKATYND